MAVPGDLPIDEVLARAWASRREEETARQWRVQFDLLLRQQGFPQCLETLFKELQLFREDKGSGSLGLVVYGQQEPGQSPLSPAGEGGAGDLYDTREAPAALIADDQQKPGESRLDPSADGGVDAGPAQPASIADDQEEPGERSLIPTAGAGRELAHSAEATEEPPWAPWVVVSGKEEERLLAERRKCLASLQKIQLPARREQQRQEEAAGPDAAEQQEARQPAARFDGIGRPDSLMAQQPMPEGSSMKTCFRPPGYKRFDQPASPFACIRVVAGGARGSGTSPAGGGAARGGARGRESGTSPAGAAGLSAWSPVPCRPLRQTSRWTTSPAGAAG